MFNEDLSGWFGLMSQRPHAFLLFLVSIPLFCPVFLFGHLTFGRFYNEIFSGVSSNKNRNALLFLWFWVLPFVLFFTFRVESREERYLLPIYPALAMLSAYGLSEFQGRLERYFSRPALARLFAVLVIVGTIAWSAPIGLESAFKERFLILEPFKLAGIFYHTAPQMLGLKA